MGVTIHAHDFVIRSSLSTTKKTFLFESHLCGKTITSFWNQDLKKVDIIKNNFYY